jgi:hypothetical protein
MSCVIIYDHHHYHNFIVHFLLIMHKCAFLFELARIQHTSAQHLRFSIFPYVLYVRVCYDYAHL